MVFSLTSVNSMRRLFGLKSKSSGPLEPLSTNHDSRAEQKQHQEQAKPLPRPSTTKPAPQQQQQQQQHGLGLSIPSDTLQEESDETTRSLHAHFAATPRVLSSVEGVRDPSASTSPTFGSAPGGGGGGGGITDDPGMRSRTSSSRLGGSTRDSTTNDDAMGGGGGRRSISPWSSQLQRTTSPLSFSPSGSLGGTNNSPYYATTGGSSIHPSLARVVSGGGTVGGDPGAIYGEFLGTQMTMKKDEADRSEWTRQHRRLGANWLIPSWWIMCRIARGRGRRSCTCFFYDPTFTTLNSIAAGKS